MGSRSVFCISDNGIFDMLTVTSYTMRRYKRNDAERGTIDAVNLFVGQSAGDGMCLDDDAAESLWAVLLEKALDRRKAKE